MKIFFIKSFVFLPIIFFTQILVAGPVVIPDEFRLLDHFFKRGVDVVYFGDSTVNWTAKNDRGQQSMSGLLQLLLPGIRVVKIVYPSYHMDVYCAYAEYLVRKGYRPRFVIVPINLRSFSPEWDRQPLWQFQNEKFAARYKDTVWMKFQRPLGVFKFFQPPISRYEYEQTKVFNGGEYIGRVKDFDNPSYKDADEEKIKKKLQFRYMYGLGPENGKILSMLKLAQVLKDHGTQIIFYITPIDVETGMKYLNDVFIKRLLDNGEVIKSVLAQRSIPVLDLSMALGTDYFTWVEDHQRELYPNEHLRLEGRMFVVKALIENTPLQNYQKRK